eukprot:CAMPEP_0182902128 /NCGR_PEP_ID=MMETSP0034_2-20130328/30222_1 /TAXON_ID=156128 /ORGANISM="Nephroselmis pyriformis, Strain CCMP717" /LENGTH=49 /DNA_ID= /DNA_START= /DNA_END= /DNA_ORIENTATION=
MTRGTFAPASDPASSMDPRRVLGGVTRDVSSQQATPDADGYAYDARASE